MRRNILLLCIHIISVCAMGEQAILLGNSVEIFASPNADVPLYTLHADATKGVDWPFPNYVFGGCNFKHEYYCEADIKQISKGRAQVSISGVFAANAPDSVNIGKCWVRLENLGIILIYKQVYNDSIAASKPSCYVRFYDSPDKKASYRDLQQSGGVATITDMHNSWFHVVCLTENQYVQGWIPPEGQCADAFILCLEH